VENEPRRLQLLDGGALAISHFKTYAGRENYNLSQTIRPIQIRTFFLESNAHAALLFPPIPMSIDPIPPRPNPPVPRAATHLIAVAPSPKFSWTTTFSRDFAFSREVNVTSKEAGET